MVGCSLVVGVGRAVGSGVATGPERGMRVQWHGSGTAGAGARGGGAITEKRCWWSSRICETLSDGAATYSSRETSPTCRSSSTCVRACVGGGPGWCEGSDDEPSVANGRVVWCGGVEIAGGSGRSAARTRAISRAQSRARARAQRRGLRVGSWREAAEAGGTRRTCVISAAPMSQRRHDASASPPRARVSERQYSDHSGPCGSCDRQGRRSGVGDRWECACVCVCVGACSRVCVCACVRACVKQKAGVCVVLVWGGGGEPPAARRTTARGP